MYNPSRIIPNPSTTTTPHAQPAITSCQSAAPPAKASPAPARPPWRGEAPPVVVDKVLNSTLTRIFPAIDLFLEILDNSHSTMHRVVVSSRLRRT
ncbi:hypothetical protein AMTR_s00068p00202070 [Amborella trichopoda]|uniref:Uncharacterized protein n=1 Tax=Amborella trichopoda TaxID=13333 RepID=U5D4N6_AMBTC|nr:hypothetical protein AMTR_s00068p00202070 [Amborella trichopoda]